MIVLGPTLGPQHMQHDGTEGQTRNNKCPSHSSANAAAIMIQHCAALRCNKKHDFKGSHARTRKRMQYAALFLCELYDLITL